MKNGPKSCRPEERRGHVAHSAERLPLSTGQRLKKSLPVCRQGNDCSELPFWESLLALGLIAALLVIFCALVARVIGP